MESWMTFKIALNTVAHWETIFRCDRTAVALGSTAIDIVVLFTFNIGFVIARVASDSALTEITSSVPVFRGIAGIAQVTAVVGVEIGNAIVGTQMVAGVADKATELAVAYGVGVSRCLYGFIAVFARRTATFRAASLQAKVPYELIPFEAVESTFKSVAVITTPRVRMRRAWNPSVQLYMQVLKRQKDSA
jgi:hypothetical protein